MFLLFWCPLSTLAGYILCVLFMREANFPSTSVELLTEKNYCLNLNFRIWIVESPLHSQSLPLYLVASFSNSLSSFLFPFSMSLHGRGNSDSDDEDSGSDRSSAIFSRIQKADHRLDSNCQRCSLLLELAKKWTRNSRDTHAARRTSGASDEPRCTCLHEPACLESGL